MAIVVPCVKRSSCTPVAPTSTAAFTTECSCARTVGTLAVRSLTVGQEHGVREGASDVDPEDRHVAGLPGER